MSTVIGDIVSFRLLTELYSFLFMLTRLELACKNNEFPSPYGVIFILTVLRLLVIEKGLRVSVSLRSYIHSYLPIYDEVTKELHSRKFPSPYGVIFILTEARRAIVGYATGFPSPYGVIFILTIK